MGSITLSESAVELEPASGVQISVGLDVHATLDWHYHCWAASDSGTADLALQGTSASCVTRARTSTRAHTCIKTAPCIPHPLTLPPPQFPPLLQHLHLQPLLPRPRPPQRRRVCQRHLNRPAWWSKLAVRAPVPQQSCCFCVVMPMSMLMHAQVRLVHKFFQGQHQEQHRISSYVIDQRRRPQQGCSTHTLPLTLEPVTPNTKTRTSHASQRIAN